MFPTVANLSADAAGIVPTLSKKKESWQAKHLPKVWPWDLFVIFRQYWTGLPARLRQQSGGQECLSYHQMNFWENPMGGGLSRLQKNGTFFKYRH
jgi:hypothetical protein